MYTLPSMHSQPEHPHALLEKTGIYFNACQTSIVWPCSPSRLLGERWAREHGGSGTETPKTVQAPTQSQPVNRTKRAHIPSNEKQTCSGPWQGESQNLPPKADCPQPSKRVWCLPCSISLRAAATHHACRFGYIHMTQLSAFLQKGCFSRDAFFGFNTFFEFVLIFN